MVEDTAITRLNEKQWNMIFFLARKNVHTLFPGNMAEEMLEQFILAFNNPRYLQIAY